ncbi:MAG: thioesterase family protein [Dehalococcoidia bacterium]|nr:thioesterase family protein [Dehalococcoidia bacterium]
MPRVRVELPETFDFSVDLPIRFSDINAGNHLAHNAILTLAQEARLIYLKHLGFTDLAYVMADAVIVFKAQAFYGQTLTIDLSVGNFAPKSCDFIYRITTKETGMEVARLKTCMVFFDYKTQKSIRVPEKFQAIFEDGKNRTGPSWVDEH